MSRLHRLLAGIALACLAQIARAEMAPSVNLIGNVGLIDMPSAEVQPDGEMTLNTSRMGPIFRFGIRFQLSPRLSGTFRYIGIHDWNAWTDNRDGVNKFDTYYDRNFDISYQILTEGPRRPALTIGLIDFAGTGINSGEYIVATKTFAGRLKLTAGLGFGRLGSYNPIFSIGTRPKVDVEEGGKPNAANWFRGDVAPFGGVEYAIDDRWTVKMEYSSDLYREEAGKRGVFDRASPFNFSVEYQPNRSFRFGAYYMYGDQLAVNVALNFNPALRPGGGLRGPAPYPVLTRPSPKADPAAWVTGWTEAEGVNATYIAALQSFLDRDIGIKVEAMEITGDRVQVRFRSTRYDAPSQAIGRVARALTHVMPAAIEVFELVPVENGMPAVKVTIHRSDLERFEGEIGAADAILTRSPIDEAGAPPAGMTRAAGLYPRLNWAILPTGEIRSFDPNDPFQVNVGVKAVLRYEVAPGVILSGTVFKMVNNDITNPPSPEPSLLPHVRSDGADYQVARGPVVDSLTAAWYGRLGPNLYGRVTAGYLERMFGGVSAEVLYRPEGKSWALGVEANYVAQRNRDGGFGFDDYDYRIATGHVSGYFDLGRGYNLQLDVGRYLAGDSGATLTLTRDFPNGWRIGGFASVTNVSAEQFGEGSFDKGVYLQIPTSWFIGRPTKAQRTQYLRPVQRDGGARLIVEGRLNETLRDYDISRITADWGRLWK